MRSTRSAFSSAAASMPPPSTSRRVRPASPSRRRPAARSIRPSSPAGTRMSRTPASSSRLARSRSASSRQSAQQGRPSAARWCVGGRPRPPSATIRSGERSRSPSSRQSRRGLSSSAVRAPTMTASWPALSLCAAARAAGPVIQRLSPLCAAIRPSRVVAVLSATSGRPEATRVRKPALSNRASASPGPVSTAMPAASSRAKPRPATRGSGSPVAATTRAIPASMSASAQGGVRP